MVKFYCCDEYYKYDYGKYNPDVKFCRYCGQKLSFNIPIIRSKQAD